MRLSACANLKFLFSTVSQGIHPNSNLYQGSLAISKSPRHVDELTRLLKNMDTEYDKCNMVCANGEVHGFNARFLYCKETSMPNSCMCMNQCGSFHTPSQGVSFLYPVASAYVEYLGRLLLMRFVAEGTSAMKAATFASSMPVYVNATFWLEVPGYV